MRYTRPSFMARTKALLYDYAIILCWMFLLGIASFVISVINRGTPDYLGMLGPIGTEALFFCLLTLPVGLYLYATESGRWRATLGKRRQGLVVTGRMGGAATRTQVVVRTAVKLLPWELAHFFIWQLQYVFYTGGYEAQPPVWIFIGLNTASVLVLIYLGMVAFRKDGRGPHDLAAGTQVAARR